MNLDQAPDSRQRSLSREAVGELVDDFIRQTNARLPEGDAWDGPEAPSFGIDEPCSPLDIDPPRLGNTVRARQPEVIAAPATRARPAVEMRLLAVICGGVAAAGVVAALI